MTDIHKHTTFDEWFKHTSILRDNEEFLDLVQIHLGGTHERVLGDWLRAAFKAGSSATQT